MQDFFNELSQELTGQPSSEKKEDLTPTPLTTTAGITGEIATIAAQDNRDIAQEVGGENGPKPHLAPSAKKHFSAPKILVDSPKPHRPHPAQHPQKPADANRPGGDQKRSEKKRRRDVDFAPSVFPDVKPQRIPALEKGKTRVIPVGGQNVIGKQMLVFQYEDEFLMVDCGVQFGEQHMLGVDYSIPDVSYLLPHKNKLRALLITHGHLDHIGALKHVLPALDFPDIYGSRLTLALIKRQLEDVNLGGKCRLIPVNPETDGIRSIGAFKFEFFHVNHSIPDACGIYIETPSAKIAHLGDYKFDFAPAIDKPSDFRKITEIGTRGIDLALAESTNSTKPGFTKSESIIGDEIARAVSQAPGRVIIATFASQVSRVKQVIDAAERYGRQVFLNGRSMVETTEICRELGIIHSKQNTLHKVTPAVNKIADQRVIILTTGSQGEENAGLYRMAIGEHPIVKIKPGDTILMSSSPIPGNERSVVDLINYLMRLGATVITNEGMDLHTSGHCYREEQKLMYSLMRPRHILPVHGELFQRVANKGNAMAVGIPAKNVFLLENGNMLEIANGVVEKSKEKMFVEELVVDGNGIGTVSGSVMVAREQMQQSGVLVVNFLAKKEKTLVREPHVESRGLLYNHEVKNGHFQLGKKAHETFNKLASANIADEKEFIKALKNELELFVLQKFGREPLVVPVVLWI